MSDPNSTKMWIQTDPDLKPFSLSVSMMCPDRRLVERVDKMLAEDIAKLMAMVPLEEAQTKSDGTDRSGQNFILCLLFATGAVLWANYKIN